MNYVFAFTSTYFSAIFDVQRLNLKITILKTMCPRKFRETSVFRNNVNKEPSPMTTLISL